MWERGKKGTSNLIKVGGKTNEKNNHLAFITRKKKRGWGVGKIKEMKKGKKKILTPKTAIDC